MENSLDHVSTITFSISKYRDVLMTNTHLVHTWKITSCISKYEYSTFFKSTVKQLLSETSYYHNYEEKQDYPLTITH